MKKTIIIVMLSSMLFTTVSALAGTVVCPNGVLLTFEDELPVEVIQLACTE